MSTKATSPKASPTIDSLSRGLQLLEIMAKHDSVKLADLPDLLGTSRATAFRVLKTLQERGYVEHMQAEQAYRLGPTALFLAARSRTSSFVRLAEPAMADLAERTGETVNLAMLRGRQLVYTEILDGRHALRMSGAVGEAAPLHSTALGKAILAAMPDEQVSALLGEEPYPASTPHTITRWKRLQRELEQSRERGYAVDLEEMDSGAICVGAAILGGDRQPVGGLSISGFGDRLPEARRREYGKLLSSWCSRITDSLNAGRGSDGAAVGA